MTKHEFERMLREAMSKALTGLPYPEKPNKEYAIRNQRGEQVSKKQLLAPSAMRSR
jgi:hypothetical protein